MEAWEEMKASRVAGAKGSCVRCVTCEWWRVRKAEREKKEKETGRAQNTKMLLRGWGVEGYRPGMELVEPEPG